MRYLNCIICTSILLLIISVDVTPKAYELLGSYDDSGNYWISNTYYS